jgi:glyoxylase-like metal-dependent hydrolase (beta-lactamase superfamily II)
MARMQLKQIKGGTYYIPWPANMGVYVRENRAVLIDSGGDKEAGRQILKLFREKEWNLTIIVNTHSNADHIGGNAFIQSKTGCPIAATRLEAAFIENPVLEPAFLYGGYPFKTLRNKFLMAKPSRLAHIIPSSGPILNTGLTAFPLGGHYFDMIGVMTPDGVAFLADSIFSEEIILKYHIYFLYNLEAHLKTLQRLKGFEARFYLPSHGKLSTDISGLVETNLAKIGEIRHLVHTFCQTPCTFDEVLARVCQHYRIELNANQYVLAGSTIRSYLSYLADQGRLGTRFSEGRMLWEQVD